MLSGYGVAHHKVCDTVSLQLAQALGRRRVVGIQHGRHAEHADGLVESPAGDGHVAEEATDLRVIKPCLGVDEPGGLVVLVAGEAEGVGGGAGG